MNLLRIIVVVHKLHLRTSMKMKMDLITLKRKTDLITLNMKKNIIHIIQAKVKV